MKLVSVRRSFLIESIKKRFVLDEIPSKKPLQIEDQIVKDENGRRRFHGAFTGGFSAGYWNTVGSKDGELSVRNLKLYQKIFILLLGFTPQEFKSSRSEKGAVKTFRPTDFMDEEDVGEFGILPHKIQTKEDFATGTTKRKFEKPSDGPIPGEPVLKNLLKPIHDKAAVRILKSMGWRDNQGIGSRLTHREKKMTNERNQREMYIQKKYGCDMGPISQANDSDADDDDEDLSDDEITFAPDDFDPYIANIKNNSFGLGYSGLKPSTTAATSQHINLFQSFEVVDRNNKKLSIRGQAFGVGALEEEDDDIYEHDDMSKYDRSLEDAANVKKKQKAIKQVDSSIIDGFSKATLSDSSVRVFTVDLSRNFIPRNWLTRRSRFTPLDQNRAKLLDDKNKHKVLGLGRHDLKPEERGALLNETIAKKPEVEVEKPKEPEDLQKKLQDAAEAKRARIQESAKRITELLNSKQFVSESNEKFLPFMGSAEKQARYDKFLTLKTSNEKEIEKFLMDIQPLSMSSFDREMEKKEFMQAKRMYQPLDSLMANRFIKEADVQKEKAKLVKKTEDGKEVAVIQRTKVMWKPHKDLCKRFNVPEPFGGMMFDEEEEKKRKKKSSSLFDYIGVPLNTKANFVAPQVIPRQMVVDDRKKNAEDEQKKSFLAAVEKEKSFMQADQTKRAAAKDFFETTEPTTSKVVPPAKIQEVKIEPPVPRTELEIKVAESIDKKPEEKKDLFKAIFCDSDDDDNDVAEQVQVTPALSETQKSTFIESFLNTKSASEINVLRNDEAPSGIFKSILQVTSSVEPDKSKEKSPTTPVANDSYGPKLPDKPQPAVSIPDDTSSSSDSSLDEKLIRKLKKAKKDREDVWVEKEKLKSKKSKKHKKEHKKKHKKHKSRK